jgi:polysaccharide export outer membrane protein
MTKLLAIVLATAACLAPSMAAAQQQPPAALTVTPAAVVQEDYTIAVQDVLNIVVWDSDDFSGKYVVQIDGTVPLPLVGRAQAAGLTMRQFETQLARSLADGFIRDPRVSVTLDQFKGQRIFVFGNVTSPGTYPLTPGQTLIETLARVGYGTASEAIVVRSKHASGPVMPESAGDAQVFRVNLKELEKDVERGSLARNVLLQDGDTVFVPRTDPTRIFVTGQVRTPGAYSITEGTTVLQALALAGGPTEEAAVNRLRIMRLVKGRQESVGAKLSDVVRPGDTLVVPERFF